ncbi:hypothetical protein BJ875DRAFT_367288 [Amylocarpus encephaloides]|uniref:C2H2-type domain-containing protein n=1 Tax=Amylocarpus encephaloides TaxID=45428 RepID=A0A9P7YSS6_9HELO|nr:hypothetical protein BJ875DRAFT_367288 [Amylocarpus encephaloides]
MTENGKKRGRPFANPETAIARAAKMPKTTQSSGIPKKKGRPIAKPIVIPPGYYIPFICEWKDCPAELINLENLRKHVYIVHGQMSKFSGTVTCRWGKCAAKHEEGVAFKEKEEWKDHIEDAHLIPFSWHMGDGPKDDSATFSPHLPKPDIRLTQPWLFDVEGNQVTPLVNLVNTEKGSALEKNKRRYEQELYLSRKARGETATPGPHIDMKYRGMNVCGSTGLSSNSASVSVVIPSTFIRPGDYTVIDEDSDEDELATITGEMGVIKVSGDETRTS